LVELGYAPRLEPINRRRGPAAVPLPQKIGGRSVVEEHRVTYPNPVNIDWFLLRDGDGIEPHAALWGIA
jgi:hypothetical protein